MPFGVFIHRSDSVYKDIPPERYQFPAQYLGRAREFEGSWVVYYEPQKVRGTRGYFAVARVERIIPDPSQPGMYLALLQPGSYLDFPNPVPFRGPHGAIETGVPNAQWAVRPLSAADFNRIVEAGLGADEPLLPRIDDPTSSGVREEPAHFIFEQDRARALTSRAVRNRAFRTIVLRAYDERCAVTGLKLINGGGRAEVVAAHIRPVEANGPDTIINGIALSGTAHWMFDRGLISLADDLQILISRQVNDRAGIESMINNTGVALPPRRAADRPHPRFLEWHREHCFKH